MKKRITTLALSLMLIMSLIPAMPATATDYGQITFGQTYSGIITEQNTSNHFTVVLTQPGRVWIDVTVPAPNEGGFQRGSILRTFADLKWTDSSDNILRSDPISVTSYFLNCSISIDLEAGTYYLEVVGTSSNTGAYFLTARFIASNSRINSSHDTSQLLSHTETIGGLISHQNRTNFYRFVLTQPGRVRVDVTVPVPNEGGFQRGSILRTFADLKWTDSSGNILRSDPISVTSYFLNCSISIDLNAGTYYLEVVGKSDYTGSYLLTADFPSNQIEQQPQAHTITAMASPSNGGTVSGGGVFQQNDTVTLTATPNMGYAFDGWFENGSKVSADASWSFTATADRALEAHFTQKEAPSQPYADIIHNPHSEWATPELEKAFELNLIPLSLMQPSVDYRDPINRAEFAAVSVRVYESLSGAGALPAVTNPFTDTSDADVLKAYNVGITDGVGANRFDPYALLNREQAATMLTRVFKRVTMPGWTLSTDGGYTLTYLMAARFADDANISPWAKDSVYFMVANNIIQGMGSNMFAPRATTSTQEAAGYATATREQALAIAVRMVENLG